MAIVELKNAAEFRELHSIVHPDDNDDGEMYGYPCGYDYTLEVGGRWVPGDDGITIEEFKEKKHLTTANSSDKL